MSTSINSDFVVIINTIINGAGYEARSGLAYEVADGVRVRTKRYTAARIEAAERVAKESLPQLHDEGITRGKRKGIEEHVKKLKANLDAVRSQISLDDLLGF